MHLPEHACIHDVSCSSKLLCAGAVTILMSLASTIPDNRAPAELSHGCSVECGLTFLVSGLL